MKTLDPADKKITATPSPAPCGACGPAKDRMQLIKTVSAQLAFGHKNLVMLYTQLAGEQTDVREMQILLEAAEVQKRLAKESEEIVVPDNLEDPK